MTGKPVRITTNATTTPISKSTFVAQIVIACWNAGTAWTLQIQDKSDVTNFKVLVPAFTLTVPANGVPLVLNFVFGGNPDIPASPRGLYMEGGIDIVTAGTTPGKVAVWIDHGEQQSQQ